MKNEQEKEGKQGSEIIKVSLKIRKMIEDDINRHYL